MMGMGVLTMSSKKTNDGYNPDTNEWDFNEVRTKDAQEYQEKDFRGNPITQLELTTVGDFEVTTSISTPGQTVTVVNPDWNPEVPGNDDTITISGAIDAMSDAYSFGDDMRVQYTNNLTQTEKFRMYPSKWVFVTFQKEGIHCWPGAKDLPGVEFLANPHRHLFKFRVEVQVFHDDREIEFILFKRELEKLYGDGILELDYKSCEMIADELAKYIKDHYPGRFMKIEVSEDGENGAVGYYEGLIKV
jgi:uncharacterized protein YqgQ